jgi:predicted nucleotidyltransferase
MKSKNKKDLIAKEILRLLKEQNYLLKKYSVKKIGLFGSFVRGDQKVSSDIDFLVEFEKPTFDNYMDLLFSLEELFERKVELITNGNLSPYIQAEVDKEVQWYEI